MKNYRYDGTLPDWNINGIIALVAGLAGGAVFYHSAFFASFPIAGVVYYLLAKRAVQAGK